jgi:hypothetical protein
VRGKPPTYVTPHAIDRAIERFPGDFPGDRRKVANLIFAEVERAIDDGRVAKTKPRWVTTGERKKARGSERFAWDLNRRHCYVIAVGNTRDGERTIVRTILCPDDDFWRDYRALKAAS